MKSSHHPPLGQTLLGIALVAILVAICLLMAFASFASPAHARWRPEYASQPQAVRDWYESRDLTAAAQKRFPFKSCCAHSDVVKTQFKVGGVGNDEWWWLDGATWRRVPVDIIHWNEHAPDGAATLFVYEGEPTCFFPADSGI